MCVGTSLISHVPTELRFQCRTQHCVCRDTKSAFARGRLASFNAARSIVCVGTKIWVALQVTSRVSMPHAALCVSGLSVRFSGTQSQRFQCRTQHCVCRDSVSRSPCPARAEKVFWKDALFLRRFWRRRMNSAPKSGGSIGAVPCAVRAAPFWKVETAVCGFAPVPKHFPFPPPL